MSARLTPDSHRARLLDELAARATVATSDADLGGWWCKSDADLPFRRSNTALPPIGVGEDAEACRAAVADVVAWYRARGRRAIIQVSQADPQVALLDAVLEDLGLQREAPIEVWIAECAEVSARAAGAPGCSVSTIRGVDEGWCSTYGKLRGGDPSAEQRTQAYGRMLDRLGGRVVGATARDQDGTIGVGFGVVEGDWVGVFGMATDPARRRQGVASGVVAALVEAGTPLGATWAYLQVEVDNAPALALYAGLGFVPSHASHYRVTAPDGAQGC